MSVNLTVNQINKIEEKFNLKFNSTIEEQLFFEMFNTLLESRVSTIISAQRGRRTPRVVRRGSSYFIRARIKREVTPFDIEICLAALCMLNWPGKSSEYKQQIEEIKYLYYNNIISRKLILNAFKNSVNNNFRNVQNRNQPFFFNLNDLLI